MLVSLYFETQRAKNFGVHAQNYFCSTRKIVIFVQRSRSTVRLYGTRLYGEHGRMDVVRSPRSPELVSLRRRLFLF